MSNAKDIGLTVPDSNKPQAIVFRLPRPLSQNGLYYNHRSGGRAASAAHSAWRQAAMQEISAQRAMLSCKRIAGAYKLLLVVERRGHLNGDLGNLEKCVSDVLVKMNVVDDDSFAEEIVLRWGAVQGCTVTIEGI